MKMHSHTWLFKADWSENLAMLPSGHLFHLYQLEILKSIPEAVVEAVAANTKE